jgi:polar amino acid transport system ATP-binding protein
MMAEPLIRVRDLEKIYGGKSVLKSISLDIYDGDTVVLIGPSGTGKSTLLRCMNLLTKPDGGSIWFDGEEITLPGVNEDRVRTHMGMVFQDFLLFNHLSALNNVAIGLIKVLGMDREAAREKAMQELAYVGLEEQADQYPGQLSGGQKQRVAIARALAMDPRVMLFDEPTSALDPELIGEVLTTMERLSNEGMTMVCVTHEMGFAREVADKIVFMEGGVVVEEGPPAQMFTAPAIPRTREFLWKITELYGDHD